jgi:alkylhydroperoxidase/carboxymuconolactone decarboxylase family protein YurZ
VKKALKFGATREEVSEAIAIAIGVNAAAIVDLTDIAAESMDLRLFPSNEKGTPVERE